MWCDQGEMTLMSRKATLLMLFLPKKYIKNDDEGWLLWDLIDPDSLKHLMLLTLIWTVLVDAIMIMSWDVYAVIMNVSVFLNQYFYESIDMSKRVQQLKRLSQRTWILKCAFTGNKIIYQHFILVWEERPFNRILAPPIIAKSCSTASVVLYVSIYPLSRSPSKLVDFANKSVD